MLFGKAIQPVVVPAEVIAQAINRAYDQATTTTAQDLMIDLDEERLDLVASELASEPRDLLEADDAAPIIKLVNGLLSQAVKDRASDIHIEVFEAGAGGPFSGRRHALRRPLAAEAIPSCDHLARQR